MNPARADSARISFAREETARMSNTAPVGADSSFDRYARMVCRSLGVPAALVSLVEDDRQIFPGACGLPPDVDAARQTPLSHSFCQYVVADQAPLVITDARQDPRLQDNLAISDLGVIAYAGWPITDHTGTIVGSLCALDSEPRAWTDEQIEMLRDLAAVCSVEFSERALRDLAGAGERTAQDLSHRSRVLLALSEGLSSTRTMADVAQAVERIAHHNLGCVQAGIWVRAEQVQIAGWEGSEPAPRPDVLVFVDSPTNTWESARLNAALPLDDTNPLGTSALHGQPLYFRTRQAQNERYPDLVLTRQIAESRSFQPLVSRGSVLGALALMWETEHALSDEDRITIEALASYTAQAAQRALLLQERLDALVTLQSALLPALPETELLELAARYRPAASRDQVGGDWYDAVVMPSGATALMVGDVVGHDIAAAAVMGQLRTMLRTIAWAVDDTPAAHVSRLDQAMADLDVDGIASLVYARVEPGSEPDGARTLLWSNAGHPPPIVVSAEGAVDFLAAGPPDLLVGVMPDGPRVDQVATIAPGATLLFYTDGLAERRGEDITAGLDRLASAVERHHTLDVEAFVDAVIGELVGTELTDDVAVLAVRLRA
jgi:serine phosphatase RsbU (regulator of sigma subunit)